MLVTIKEKKPGLNNCSVFTIVINQKNSMKLEKGKKRSIIFNKSTRIKVRKFFLESNEIEVSKSCLLEISLNKFCLTFQSLLVCIFLYLFSFFGGSIAKIIFSLLTIFICFHMKNNWYRLAKVEQRS
ncbi:hypothetical protein [Enterococcus rivorum]|uniref:Transmembrane protein n=1 Tax=Enterococcus rivorum TaxID=762845 RepID=A0A1E5KSW1_9ENTE|nr:hypothetical protein [Enterococcus rivorum]MBP2098016.1 hypothetical protein [Enterococcus rivorum]OEH80967.1 hypothetical protein BCR26_05470 [Enterococcus rivorum]